MVIISWSLSEVGVETEFSNYERVSAIDTHIVAFDQAAVVVPARPETGSLVG